MLVARAIELNADAILVSQTVTQQNLHVSNLTELVEIVEAEGKRSEMILTCGGPRVSNELAKELGYDAGFSKGTYPLPRGELHRARAGRARPRGRAPRPAGRAPRARMAEAAADRLADLLAGTRRVALVGLAKNTGKTETLAAILRELAERETCVGVTSIGRDGEEHDVIDARIEKPRIVLQAGSLVASTDALVRASGLAHERLAQTGVRTPLGEVVIARLAEQGAVEVAGPSAAEDLRKVSDAMIGFGAEIVLIDGSIDRRAASSPAVADGLVIATGAVLSEDIERSSRPRRTRSISSGCLAAEARVWTGQPAEARSRSRWSADSC